MKGTLTVSDIIVGVRYSICIHLADAYQSPTQPKQHHFLNKYSLLILQIMVVVLMRAYFQILIPTLSQL